MRNRWACFFNSFSSFYLFSYHIYKVYVYFHPKLEWNQRGLYENILFKYNSLSSSYLFLFHAVRWLPHTHIISTCLYQEIGHTPRVLLIQWSQCFLTKFHYFILNTHFQNIFGHITEEFIQLKWFMWIYRSLVTTKRLPAQIWWKSLETLHVEKQH